MTSPRRLRGGALASALLVIAGLAAVAGGVMSVRALRLAPVPDVEAPPLDAELAGFQPSPGRLSAALTFQTVSTQDTAARNPAPFIDFHNWLATAFPAVHASLAREVIGGYSLLYTWKGSDSSLAPILLTGHFDVVPVEAGTEGMWERPPFSGAIHDGFIWGRGALDDKVTVIGLLEAVELLASRGFVPGRTVLLAFGHDEEIGGYGGAAELARTIGGRFTSVAFLVDEGGIVADSLLPGVGRRAAMVGVAEKASMSLELSVVGAGGHSSMPPARTALGVLGRALAAIEDNQMPARLTPVTRALFGSLAPEMGFGARFAFANLGLLEPLVLRGLVREPRTASLVRTSTAVTMASGSPRENVLPIRATAVVNFRMLQGDSVESVVAHVRRVVADTAVRISVLGTPRKPSPTADFDSPEFAMLSRTIAQAYPGAIVLPNLLAGATDTRHYESLTRNIYRFVPAVVTPRLLSGPHGTNERIRASDYIHGVRFWAQLIRNAQ